MAKYSALHTQIYSISIQIKQYDFRPFFVMCYAMKSTFIPKLKSETNRNTLKVLIFDKIYVLPL